jgi:hypothetical protein
MGFFKKRGYVRKNSFIDRRQQTKFAFEVVFHSFLFAMCTAIFFVLPPFNRLLLGKTGAAMQDIFISNILMFARYWWVFLLALFISGYFSVLFSHRIFGPIRRLTLALEDIENGVEKPRPCSLRKGDYFTDFAQHLDRFIKHQITEKTDKGRKS